MRRRADPVRPDPARWAGSWSGTPAAGPAAPAASLDASSWRLLGSACQGRPPARHRAPAPSALATPVPEIDQILRLAALQNASDLHVQAGLPPTMRVNRELQPMEHEPLAPERIERLVTAIMTEPQRRRFAESLECDFSYGLPGVARFRVNVFRQRGTVAAAFRRFPDEIPTPEAIGLGRSIVELTKLKRGFVLITGAAGQGKSTTLAALIDRINAERAPTSSRSRTRSSTCSARGGPGRAARARRRHGLLRCRPAGGAARGSRRDPGRRDARPAHRRGRADRGRDRPPGLRHPAHEGRGAEHRPHRGRLPDAPAAAQTRIQLAHTLSAVVAQQLLVRRTAAASPSRSRCS